MTEQKIQEWKDKIDEMSQIQMASMWRFSPSGHVFFDSTLPLFDYFKARFDSLGGFTPSISKQIGW